MAYAGVSELEARWRSLDETEQARAAVLLEDASAMLDALTDGPHDPEAEPDYCKLLAIVACNMVQRSMGADADAFGLSQQTMTAGPYSQSWSFSNPSGDFYLTKAEKSMLGLGGGIGHIRPMIGGDGHAA